MSIKSLVPNALTLLNLLSGLLAILFVVNQEFYGAFYMVCLGILFDFLDGFAARLLGVSSELGVQLDSLADMVTSGVMPGLILFYLLMESVGVTINSYANGSFLSNDLWIPLLGFLVTLGSCYRLAKFNIDKRQTESFIGLPTPANCLMIASLPLLVIENKIPLLSEWISSTWFLVSLAIISTYLLNSEIHLFSLKIKSKDWYQYKVQLLFVLFSILFLIVIGLYAVPFVILLYILLSLILPSKKTIF